MNAILAGYAGKADMLRAVFGTADETPKEQELPAFTMDVFRAGRK